MARKSVDPPKKIEDKTRTRKYNNKESKDPLQDQPICDAFAAKLVQLMSEKRLSQAELGRIVAESKGITGNLQTVVWRWCNAKGLPKFDDAIILKRKLGVTLDYLMDPDTKDKGAIEGIRAEILSLVEDLGPEVAKARLLNRPDPDSIRQDPPSKPGIILKTQGKTRTKSS